MLNWSQQFQILDTARRRVYVLAAAVAALVQVGVTVLDVLSGAWLDVPSTVLGATLAAGVTVAASRRSVPLERINHVIAGGVTLAVLADLYPALHQPGVAAHQYLSFVLLATLWFGLLPGRVAAWLSGAAYVGFTALALGRPEYDVSVLTYLACVTAVVGLAASFGQHVTRHQHDAAAFQRDALTDPLTGLPNRRAMRRHLEEQWEAVQASGGTSSFGLLMIDLDHFKAINDTFTHTVGDQVLVATGPALAALTGDHAVLARWGGEEFMLLLPGADARAAYAVARRLDGAALPVGGGVPPVTFSAGAALSHEAATVDDVLALVDRRLHAAKDAGRRQVRWDTRPTGAAGPAVPAAS